MSTQALHHDPLWPRATSWISTDAPGVLEHVDLALLGVGTFRHSITPGGTHSTPSALRQALARYSTHSGRGDTDLSSLLAWDLGDVDDPDAPGAAQRVRDLIAPVLTRARLIVALGGDNALTRPVMQAAHPDLARSGLVTIDAHHDVRDGHSNGSPVRELVEAGLDPTRIVQVGIADFANSGAYRRRVDSWGITVISRDEIAEMGAKRAMERALAIAGAGQAPIHLDIDVDVCDRAAVPACPAALPGGISAFELRQMVSVAAMSPSLRSVDIAEIDASCDAPDGRTVRLGALLILDCALGLARRT